LDNPAVCGAVRPVLAPFDRMTLTLTAVMQAHLIILHLVGEDKKQVLQVAQQPGPVAALPVRAILHQTQVPTEIYFASKMS